MDFDLGLSDDDDHSDLSFGSLDVDLPMDHTPAPPAAAAKPAAAAATAPAPAPQPAAAVARAPVPAPAPAPVPAAVPVPAVVAPAPAAVTSPPAAAPSNASALAVAAAAVVARKRAAAEAQAAEGAKRAPPPADSDDDDDELSDGSLNFSSDSSLDVSDDEPPPTKKPAAKPAAPAPAPAKPVAAAAPPAAAALPAAAPVQVATAAPVPTTIVASAPVAFAPRPAAAVAAPAPAPVAAPTPAATAAPAPAKAAAVAPPTPDRAREDSFSLGDLDDDLDLGHDDLDFDFDKRHSAATSKVSSAVASPAPASRTVKQAPAPQEALAKQAAHAPPPAAAAAASHTSPPPAATPASSSSFSPAPSVVFTLESDYGDDRAPASTDITQPSSQAASPGARSHRSPPAASAPGASAGAGASPVSSVASAEEYAPSRSHFSYESAPPAQQQPAQQAGHFFGQQGRSTAETVATARERQHRKDEYAERVLAGQDYSEATLYEHGSSAALWGAASAGSGAGGAGGGGGGGFDDQTQSSEPRRRTRAPRPAKPDFMITSKTPISKKLQQLQRDAHLYNNTPRTSTKKKAPTTARRTPSTRAENQGMGSGAGAGASDLSDEEAAMARLEGRPRQPKQQQQQHGVESSDPPVEYDDDAPWLDSVSNVMGGLGGGARPAEGRPRGHRASIVFQQHEPLVGQAPNVEELSANMQRLFEMQRLGAGSALVADQVPRAKKDSAPRGMVTVFGQRVPASQFPSFAPASSAAQGGSARSAKKSTAPLVVGGPRTQAEQAQVAIAAALASIGPAAQPLLLTEGPGAGAASASASASASPATGPVSSAQTPMMAAASLEEVAAGVNEVDDPEEAAHFDAAYTALSPDAYYARQLSLQNSHAPGHALPAIDFTKQLRAYAGEDTDSAEQHPEMDGSRSRRRNSGDSSASASSFSARQAEQHEQLGYTLPVPSNTGKMYLRALQDAARKKAARWVEVSSVSAAWGASLGSGSAGTRKRGLGAGDSKGQYARSVKPGRFSVEKKRARALASLVEQRTAQHLLSQQQAATYDQGQGQGHGHGGGGGLSLMGLAYSGVEDHPALQQHMQLLDGHPEAAHFLAGGGSADAGYLDHHQQQQYYGDEADEQQQYDDEYGHGYGQGPEEPQEQGHFGPADPNQLRAELMGALHAGLFGSETSARHAQEQLQLHEHAFGEEQGDEAEGGGRLPFVSPHRLSEAGPAVGAGGGGGGGAAAFHFKNASGLREFVAEGEHDAQEVRSFDGGPDDASVASGSQSTITNEGGGATEVYLNDYGYGYGYGDERGYGHGQGYDPSSSFAQGPPALAWESARGPPEHQSSVVPHDMLEQVVAQHFLGRDLHRSSAGQHHSRPQARQQTSKSASKRRTDVLMQRLFDPEKARAASVERLAAIQAAEKEAKAARRREQAARRPASASASASAASNASRTPNYRQPPMAEQQHPHPHGNAHLSTLNEESQSQSGSRGASQAASQVQSPYTSSLGSGPAHPSGGSGGGYGSEDATAAAAPMGYTHVDGLGMVPIIPPSAFSVTHDAGADAHASVDDGAQPHAGAEGSGNLLAALAGANSDAYIYGADEHLQQQQQEQQGQHSAEQEHAQAQAQTKTNADAQAYAQAQAEHSDAVDAARAALRARQHAASVEAKKRATILRQKREAEIAAISARYSQRTGREPSPPRKAALPVDMPLGPEPSRLDMLYYKAKLSAQRLTSLRVAQAAAELASCTFQPNLDVVQIKGKLTTKTSLAAMQRARSGKNKSKRAAGSAAANGESDLSEDESSVHSSTAAASSSQSTAMTAAPGAAAATASAAATKARLDALYASHSATQSKIRQAREAASQAQAAAEAAQLTFTPNVHPHRPVAATVALANTRYIKGFDEKVGMMRRGTAQANAQSFAGSLRPSAPGSAGSMSFSLDPSPVHVAHADYIAAAGRSVVVSAQVPRKAAGPGTDSATLPFAAVASPRDFAAMAHAGATLRPEAHTPVPQIVMPGAPGTAAPIQMLCGTNPGSPSSLNFPPSSNRTTLVQDGQALDDTLRRADGRGTLPPSLGGPGPNGQAVGLGSLEGTERLQSPAVASAVAAAASAAALNPGGLGLGIVLPNNSPGSIFPRALAVHDHVSSYSYQYTKKQIVESGAPTAPSLAPSAFPLRSARSGTATPTRTRAAAASSHAVSVAATPQSSAAPPPLMVSPSAGSAPSPAHVAAASPSATATARAAVPSPARAEAVPASPKYAAGASGAPPSPSRLSSPASSSTGAAAAAAAIAAAAPNSSDDIGASNALSPSRADDPAAASSASSSPDDPSAPEVLLFVDIQLGAGTERIVVHVGDRSDVLAAEFTRTHNLDAAYAPVIQGMLDQQIAALTPNQ